MSKRSTKPEEFLDKTFYPGGPKAMAAFIQKHLRYPKEALENKVEGKVTLFLHISKEGRVTKVQVKKGLGHGCDEEAVRLAKLLRFTKTRNKKVRVLFHKTIHIPFKLPAVKGLAYQYTSTSAGEKKETEQKKPSSGYTYTIKIGG
jgi:protein TonB